MSEEMVVRQAAPTLAGIKTGSLFPCPCMEKETLLEEIRAFNRRYLSRGLCLLPLRFTEGKALLYLYRPAALRRDLRGQTAEALLADAGYEPLSGSATGDPTGKAWVECGDLDHFGHEHGLRLARDIDGQLAEIVERMQALADAGWRRFRGGALRR